MGGKIYWLEAQHAYIFYGTSITYISSTTLAPTTPLKMRFTVATLAALSSTALAHGGVTRYFINDQTYEG
jgi:hypothetical protein